MNFDQATYPLTEFLADKGFSVTKKEQHFIEYCSDKTVISIAYASIEYLFYTHVGQDPKSLIELTPSAVKHVFNDDRFQHQSTLTIDNLISFFRSSGKLIISGDKQIFRDLDEFSKRQAREYTKRAIHFQSIKMADKAWVHKDYAHYIECIDMAERNLVSELYLKKYQIAVEKLKRRDS